MADKTPLYDYDKSWKQVNEFINKGLPESALKTVREINEAAKKEENGPQHIKSQIHIVRFTIQLNEEGSEKAIAELYGEMDTATKPLKQILSSMIAEIMHTYMNNKNYLISQRSETAQFEKEDIATWSMTDFVNEISALYMASLEDKSSLDVDLEKYKIILTDYNQKGYSIRSNLYELLSDRALNYFSTPNSFITQPVYKFNIDNESYFKAAKDFVREKYTSKDEDALLLKAVKLHQEVLKHYIRKGNENALAYVDLQRLDFIYQNAIVENKDTLYGEALDQMLKSYDDVDFYASLCHSKAQNLAQSKKEGKNKEAITICKDAIDKYSESAGAARCKDLINGITQETFDISVEEIYIPDQKILFLTRYKNLGQLALRLYKIDQEDKVKIRNVRTNDARKYIRDLDEIRAWSIDLPASGDHEQMSLESHLDKQEMGTYVLAASNNKDFGGEDAFSYAVFTVSDLSYGSINDREGLSFVVTSRTSGRPLENVRATFYKQQYQPSSGGYERQILVSARSDSKGFINVPQKYAQSQIGLILEKGEDLLDLNKLHYPNRVGNPRPYGTIHIFTDRAIYRPGQVVHFKGLCLNIDQKQVPSLFNNLDVQIKILDANNQELYSEKLRSNEFGSFNGSYTLPDVKLTGNFRILADGGRANGNHYIRVEEYKRPKFTVKIEPDKRNVKLGDTVQISGEAEALAGVSIDGAKVKYRVSRTTYIPYWMRYYRYPLPNQTDEQQLAFGEIETDENGKFEFEFEALFKGSLKDRYLPNFVYQIEVDVKDINGETRSASYSMQLNKTGINLGIDVKDMMDSGGMDGTEVSATNYAGIDQDVAVTLNIYKLEEPGAYFREKYWQQPDNADLDRDGYRKEFPHFPYEKNNFQDWKVAFLHSSYNFDTGESKNIIFSKDLEAGVYKMVVSAEGETMEKFVQVTDFENNAFPNSALLFHNVKDTIYQPGDNVELLFGTPDNDVSVLVVTEKNGRVTSKEWLEVRNKNRVQIPVLESDRGNFFIRIIYNKDNRVYNEIFSINVPWNNKALQIEYATFRDKLDPGQNEEWTLKIKGPDGNAISAEVLASMYDASLDQFVVHDWNQLFYPTRHSYLNIQIRGYNAINGRHTYWKWNEYRNERYELPTFPTLNWFGSQLWGNQYVGMGMESNNYRDGVRISRSARPESAPMMMEKSADLDAVTIMADAEEASNSAPVPEKTQPTEKEDLSNVKIRTNLNETVFFFPDLKTDEEGNTIISFKMNEALTKWNFITFAHTKDLKYAFGTKEIVTRKELMVFPNPPRFMREGDKITFSAKISNLSDKDLTGEVELQLFDALTMKRVDDLLSNTSASGVFNVKAGLSTSVEWDLEIPFNRLSALTHRVVAKSGNYSDGEESSLPVVTNRTLVTETMPMFVKGKETKSFDFESMRTNTSNTLNHHRYSFEFTANPVWYALQSMPYLMEYPHPCTEQIFNRYYANSIATHVMNAHPRIKAVYDQWRAEGSDALLSNLSKNQELKSALLEETPWVFAAQSEEEQKRNIAVLFDLNRMAFEKKNAIDQLVKRQLSNGGFPWFPEGRDNEYMTQYIAEGIGHLQALDVLTNDDPRIMNMLTKALRYVDMKLEKRYERLKERVEKGSGNMDDDHLDALSVHYLYMRSFFGEIDVISSAQEAKVYYTDQAKKYWLKKSVYEQGLIGLAMLRTSEREVSLDIAASLKERAIKSEELGMYWKQNGFYWYQLPIERQALLIEFFLELGGETATVEAMQIWLLKNKQTTHWKTTKATASAIYSMIISPVDGKINKWVEEDEDPEIKVGGQTLSFTKSEQEAGTGYVKKNWNSEAITSSLSEIEITNNNESIAWGAAYWQYFEDLDNIKTFEDTPLKLNKKLFKEVDTDTGKKILPIEDNTSLKVGDKVVVRIELRVDRPMEYIHMKDMRSSGFEPINVLSRNKYQQGLSYYESTRDLATHFFISWLPRGTYVFEYPVRVAQRGYFSNGVTTIQSMYAPEFSSHSEGVRVRVF